MKICITAQGSDLNARVDPRFGRCRYFLIIDTDSLEYEAIENGNMQSSGGAGIQSGQLVASKQIEAVVTGNVGPNAFTTLNAAGIAIYVGADGTVKEAIQAFKSGKLKSVSSASTSSHSGMPNKKDQ